MEWNLHRRSLLLWCSAWEENELKITAFLAPCMFSLDFERSHWHSIVEPLALSKGHPEERTLGKSKSHMSYDNLQSAMHWTKLLALVYNILPSTTAVFSYAIGSRKLSANEQFLCWCSNSSSNTIQYNFIAKCQYNDCMRNVLWCQVHASHIHSNHKTITTEKIKK